MGYLFRTDGRIGRGAYCQALINYIAAIVLLRVFSILWGRLDAGLQIWGMLAFGIACLSIAISFVLVSRQRLRDLDKDDRWLLLYFGAPAIFVALGHALVHSTVGAGNIIGGLLTPVGIGLALWGVTELAIFPSRAPSS